MEVTTTSPEAGASQAPVSTEAIQEQATGVTPSSDDSVNVDEVITGWNDDRSRLSELERENFELKRKLSSTSREDEDDDLSIDERVEREIQKREKEKSETQEFSRSLAEREASFMRRTSVTFRKNEKSILQIAVDGKMNLSEATKVFATRQSAIAQAKEDSNASAKKNAGHKPGGSSGGSVGTTKYNPTTDKNKSIGDMYREGLGI